ncbi:MAG: uroporphyrinogen decarboxylase family protein [Planctomycetota bacterium]
METNFAELHRQVVFGQSGGRIIWQPRIGCWVNDKRFAGEKLPEPFDGMTMPQIFRELKCSARIYQYNACFKRAEHPAVRVTQRALNETDAATTIETPVGKQVWIGRKSKSNPHVIHVKWEIATEEEMKVATWRTENATWAWDQAKFNQLRAEWGDLGAPTMYMPRINIQDLFINTMGVQNGIYALYDWPDTVRAYFRALDECHSRLIDVINESPVDIINFGDNIHCATLPPDLFREFVLPAYHKRCDKLHAAGKFVHAHWDGDTKALLPLARETKLDGIEAITPKPQGDVTLEEVKDALGDDLFLIDGIPAILFDPYFSVAELEDFTHRLIEMFAPKLVLGISDEISSTGDIERIRLVGDMVNAYNKRVADEAG